MALFQWGRWYRNIMEMPAADRPDDALLHDDERLDRWFDQYTRDQARKSGRKGGDPRYDFTGRKEDERPKAIEVYDEGQMKRRGRGKDSAPDPPEGPPR